MSTPNKGDAGADLVTFSIQLPRVLADAMNVHSRLLRRVSRARLVQDIVTCWVHTATDWKDPMFRQVVSERQRVPDTPERYPGYLVSIGFAPAVRVEAAISAKEIPSVPREDLS